MVLCSLEGQSGNVDGTSSRNKNGAVVSALKGTLQSIQTMLLPYLQLSHILLLGINIWFRNEMGDFFI
jgi:hypothetical protein